MTMKPIACATCPYWQVAQDKTIGECRGNTPGIWTSYQSYWYASPTAIWPITMSNHWCGAHPDFTAEI